MTSLKIKQQKHSKRIKTQPLGYSAFDESIIFLVISKIQKSLYDISKSKFQQIQRAIAILDKDINVISQQCKHKTKIKLLLTHIIIFEMIHNQKYEEALKLVHKEQSHFNQKTHRVLKLSISLIQALLLRFLERQQESTNIINQAISQINLKQIRVNPKSFDQKVVQSAIVCISIIAQHFGSFESQSEQFKRIYHQAYRIADKYLTQYHKLTSTLFMICNKHGQSIQTTKKKNVSCVKKRRSLVDKSNRSFLKQSTTDRPYMLFSIQPKVKSTLQNSDLNFDIRKTVSRRLKTLQLYANSYEQKQKLLKKLYGTQTGQSLSKSKKPFKRPRLSMSLKSSAFEPQVAVQMKQLEKISKIYLPKLQVKKRSMQERRKDKLDAVEVIKFGLTLSRLKPLYFDELKVESTKQVKNQKAITTTTIATFNESKSKQEPQQHNKPQTISKQIRPSFDDIVVEKELKQELLIPLKQQKQEGGCQLI